MKVRGVVAVGAGILVLSGLFALASDVAATEPGKVRGITKDGVISYKGIPYAAPPVGDLRWRSPRPVDHWKGVRSAEKYGHDCMQLPFPSDAAPLGTTPAEDCLVLNVWTPAEKVKKATCP